MRYLQLKEEFDNKSNIESMLKLPYNDFVTKLSEICKMDEFQKKLNSGNKDDSNLDDQIKVSTDSYFYVDKLEPSQSKIGLRGSFNFVKEKNEIATNIVKNKLDDFTKNRVIVGNGKYILDGHHRWSQIYLLNPKAKIPCINIEIPGINEKEQLLKIFQLGIAATFKEIALNQKEVETNILSEDVKKYEIKEKLPEILGEDLIKSLGETLKKEKLDIKRLLVRLAIPKILLESNSESNAFEELDNTDNNNPGIGSIAQTGADIAGIFDPTGVVDVLNGISYLYQGEYLLAICCFISAVPLGDLIGKPIIAILKSKAIIKLSKYLAKTIREMDVKKTAEIFEILGKKYPAFKKFTEKINEFLPKILNVLEKIFDTLGKHYTKIKIFYTIIKSKLIGFFKDVLDWKKKLQEWLNGPWTSEEVIDYIVMNAQKIKNNKPDILFDFKFAPHPILSAEKSGYDIKDDANFKGLPTTLINKLLSGDINFREKKKVKKYSEYK